MSPVAEDGEMIVAGGAHNASRLTGNITFPALPRMEAPKRERRHPIVPRQAPLGIALNLGLHVRGR